jgi:hypothetical protein
MPVAVVLADVAGVGKPTPARTRAVLERSDGAQAQGWSTSQLVSAAQLLLVSQLLEPPSLAT